MIPPESDQEILHATSIAVGDRGVLILGPSGAGKSALALQLMALGARLIADDQTIVIRRGNRLYARCPPSIAGRIEARGLGILAAPSLPEAGLHLAIDLGREESDRLPPRRSVSVLGVPLDLVLKSQATHFPAAVLCYLQGGRLG